MGYATALQMSSTMQGRRIVLRRLAAFFVTAAASSVSAERAKDENHFVCADPNLLSQDQNRQRNLDNYTEKSLDPARTCSGCEFFTAGAALTACGKCGIFNGPANPKGRCDDWVAR
jgi:hypothetical protein